LTDLPLRRTIPPSLATNYSKEPRMGTTMGLFAGVGGLLFVILCIILAIAWIVLPFALIGTKPILRQILAETRRTNELLSQLRAGAGSTTAQAPRVG
jgi:hypothetical protein